MSFFKRINIFRKGGRSQALKLGIYLKNINDMFISRQINPLRQEVLFSSGMEKLINEMRVRKSWKEIKLALYLPKEKIEEGLDQRMKKAIQQYCDFKISQVSLKNRMQRIETFKSFLEAIIIMGLLLFISQLIENLQPFGSFWNVFISEGLFIGAWVSLWHPIELLLFERWYERYDKHIYQHIVDNLEVIIKEW
jgi:hypothetical protein